MEAIRFEDVVASAASSLVSVEHGERGSFVTTSAMYPGGGAVVVWVDRSPPYFTVTDFGFGLREVELMGADKRAYAKVARSVADEAGVTINADGSFLVVVEQSNLTGAMKVIASCSQETTARVTQKHMDKQRKSVADDLFINLVRVFGKGSVAREVEYRGQSQTDWRISATVKTGGSVALFEAVTPYFPSVAATLAKFGDIRQLETPPPRTAVIGRRPEYGTWLSALSQTAHVVDLAANDSVYLRASGA